MAEEIVAMDTVVEDTKAGDTVVAGNTKDGDTKDGDTKDGDTTTGDTKAEDKMAESYSFLCSMGTDKDTYAKGEVVQLSFKLTNTNDCDVYVLNWNTPLEGMRNNYLDVTVGGEKIPYHGPMFKRGRPTADSYTLILAGKTADDTVEMTKGYSTKTCGKYSVRLNTNLVDVVPRKVGVDFAPNGFDQFTSVAIPSNIVEFDVVC